MTPRKKATESSTPSRPRKPRAPAAQVSPSTGATERTGEAPAQHARIATPPPRAHVMPPEQRTRRIAELAYQRFLARGGTHGLAMEDWLEAERQFEAEERRQA